MKKNIQINLFGTLYNIDDDAYNLLEQYIDSMRRYFSNQDGGEEIADDIEHRVAELLWQKKQQGMEAVDIDSVKEIISQIGNPQDIDGDAADTGSAVTDAEYVEADDNCRRALEQLPQLQGCQVHSTVMLSEVDRKIFKKLGVGLTCEPVKKKS